MPIDMKIRSGIDRVINSKLDVNGFGNLIGDIIADLLYAARLSQQDRADTAQYLAYRVSAQVINERSNQDIATAANNASEALQNLADAQAFDNVVPGVRSALDVRQALRFFGALYSLECSLHSAVEATTRRPVSGLNVTQRWVRAVNRAIGGGGRSPVMLRHQVSPAAEVVTNSSGETLLYLGDSALEDFPFNMGTWNMQGAGDSEKWTNWVWGATGLMQPGPSRIDVLAIQEGGPLPNTGGSYRELRTFQVPDQFGNPWTVHEYHYQRSSRVPGFLVYSVDYGQGEQARRTYIVVRSGETLPNGVQLTPNPAEPVIIVASDPNQQYRPLLGVRIIAQLGPEIASSSRFPQERTYTVFSFHALSSGDTNNAPIAVREAGRAISGRLAILGDMNREPGTGWTGGVGIDDGHLHIIGPDGNTQGTPTPAKKLDYLIVNNATVHDGTAQAGIVLTAYLQVSDHCAVVYRPS